MKINTSDRWLPVYEALASDVRLKIISLLSRRPMNIKELAAGLGLSSAIVSMHVKKLENGGIIRSERVGANGASQKLCRLDVNAIEIVFPGAGGDERECHEYSLPVGHFTDLDIYPTCGLATRSHIIGQFDDPRSFLSADRVNAGILWFTRGFIEYTIPNYLLADQTPDELYISLEIGSEAPGVNSNWPSDITFSINDVPIGTWTSPGDPGGSAGRYTPKWWGPNINQFGFYKLIKIDRAGTFIDGDQISGQTLDDVKITRRYWKFRLSVLDESVHRGGLTIFGSGFGNYNQDIDFTLYYR